MRFCTLGSGSRGNATLIDSGNSLLLLDCGFPARELEKRMQDVGVAASDLSAILVTHEHGDHIKGVGAVSRRYKLPVWATYGTLRKGRFGKLHEEHVFNSHKGSFRINDVEILPVPVPHDACEPCQYLFSANQKRLGILTDLGCLTPQIKTAYRDLDLLLLETNHDLQMLSEGPYPLSLQQRVGGNLGHLNNSQAMSLLLSINRDKLKHLVFGHLSEKNNHPDKISQAMASLDELALLPYSILEQDRVSPWFTA